jgi:hypothetical protein
MNLADQGRNHGSISTRSRVPTLLGTPEPTLQRLRLPLRRGSRDSALPPPLDPALGYRARNVTPHSIHPLHVDIRQVDIRQADTRISTRCVPVRDSPYRASPCYLLPATCYCSPTRGGASTCTSTKGITSKPASRRRFWMLRVKRKRISWSLETLWVVRCT